MCLEGHLLKCVERCREVAWTENGEGGFRFGGGEFEVLMRQPGGAAQRLSGACGSAAQRRPLAIGGAERINSCT